MQFKQEVKLDFKVGQHLQGSGTDRIYKVIGYEVMPGRGTRYILQYFDNGASKWEYLFKFEIVTLME
jgi:hypothetical protein